MIEHPTWNFRPVPREIVNAVSADIHAHLDQGLCVVLVDSGGETRTKTICSLMDYAEDSAVF
jgi:hypothetical protein